VERALPSAGSGRALPAAFDFSSVKNYEPLLCKLPAWYHFPVPITDTSAAAQAVQLNLHRSMSGERKIALAYEMSMFGRELNRSRLRQEHPEWKEKEITRELLRLAFFPKPLPAGLK
jgi:hypothetical protein